MAQALAERNALKSPEWKTKKKADWLRWGRLRLNWLRRRWMAPARVMGRVAVRPVGALMETWMHSVLPERMAAPGLLERTA